MVKPGTKVVGHRHACDASYDGGEIRMWRWKTTSLGLRTGEGGGDEVCRYDPDYSAVRTPPSPLPLPLVHRRKPSTQLTPPTSRISKGRTHFCTQSSERFNSKVRDYSCYFLSTKSICQKWDSNPCPHLRTRSLMMRTPYQGARQEP